MADTSLFGKDRPYAFLPDHREQVTLTYCYVELLEVGEGGPLTFRLRAHYTTYRRVIVRKRMSLGKGSHLRGMRLGKD